MNIINKLTLRHLKENKRRTLVTIIGVVISVAMLTAVATLAVSFIDLAQKQHIGKEGEWHALYKNVNEKQLEDIRADKNTKDVILSNDLGYAYLEGSQNKYKPYLFLKQYNKEGFDHFPITLTEGKMPTIENELLISEHILTNGKVNLKVGDKITLDVGERVRLGEPLNDYALNQSVGLETNDEKVIEEIQNTTEMEYTIVGIIERPDWERMQAPGYTVLSYLDEAEVMTSETVNASVIWKNVSRSIRKEAETLGETLQVEDHSINNDLLRYYGVINNDGMRATMYSLVGIIMSVIIVGSVSLIYNAFAISVSERSRHLGMLSSVGATKTQKRNSVFFEGFIIGLIGIPLGIISGLAGIGATFYFINPLIQDTLEVSEKLSVIVTPLSIIVACAVSIFTIFISTYIPAKKASNVSAIDAIRQTTDVKLTGKEVKTSKLVRKVFGIEAEFGLKNLKRNKRRYQAVVLSLVVSIVLFMTVSFFTDQLKKSSEYITSGVNYDIAFQSYDSEGYKDSFNDEMIESIKSLDGVTGLSHIYSPSNIQTVLNEKQIPESLKESPIEQLDPSNPVMYIHLEVLDEKNLKRYTDEVGVSYEEITSKDKISGIVINSANASGEKMGRIKAINMDEGESLELSYYDWDTDESDPFENIEVVALTDKFPLGLLPLDVGELTIVISEATFDQLNKDDHLIEGTSALYITSSDPIGIHENLESLKNDRMYIQNYQKIRQEENQIILLMSVFIYGFIALISAISIANIFNTISTSVSLRKREFAMLKSVGMTPKGFNRMINYESIFYGIKSLAYGLPLSAGIMYLIYRSMSETFDYAFKIPWLSVLIVVAAVFMIVGSAMLYSSAKVRKETIIDGLKQENS